ncbi:MAG: DoxX family protein [Spirochaetia bacterium]|nr:DoxX family protein [Spirochaetia bacterium]
MKILYWATSILFSIGISFSGIGYIGALPELMARLQHLGYPEYFRFIIGSCYTFSAIILAIPISAKIKEWAYAISTYNVISLIASHLLAGDSIFTLKRQILLLILLGVSYLTFLRLPLKPIKQ